jgi:hypothetical protein
MPRDETKNSCRSREPERRNKQKKEENKKAQLICKYGAGHSVCRNLFVVSANQSRNNLVWGGGPSPSFPRKGTLLLVDRSVPSNRPAGNFAHVDECSSPME